MTRALKIAYPDGSGPWKNNVLAKFWTLFSREIIFRFCATSPLIPFTFSSFSFLSSFVFFPSSLAFILSFSSSLSLIISSARSLFLTFATMRNEKVESVKRLRIFLFDWFHWNHCHFTYTIFCTETLTSFHTLSNTWIHFLHFSVGIMSVYSSNRSTVLYPWINNLKESMISHLYLCRNIYALYYLPIIHINFWK